MTLPTSQEDMSALNAVAFENAVLSFVTFPTFQLEMSELNALAPLMNKGFIE
jgi:hypothetical protein